jgi:hypothetical protein
MGASQRRRGADIEREIVQRHRELGLHTERVPLRGASRYQNNGADVDIYVFGKEEAPLVSEVKARRGGAGFVTLEMAWRERRAVPAQKQCRSNRRAALAYLGGATSEISAIAGMQMPFRLLPIPVRSSG